MAKQSANFAVVGGGISGIAAAHFLRARNIGVEIFEKDAVLGGRVGSGKLGKRSIDFGGKNIGHRYHLFRSFVRSLGDFRFEPFGINSSRVRNGRIVTLDSSRRLRSTFHFLRDCPKSDVFKLARLCANVLIDDRNRFLGAPYFSALARRHDGMPLASHFSQYFCNAVVRAMSVRMNGAEPDEVYLGNFGTNLGMWLDTYDQLQSGMGSVLQAFERTTRVHLGTRVDELIVRGGRVAGLRVTDRNGKSSERQFDGVVLATPAVTAAGLLRAVAPELAAALDAVRYFPVMVAIAEYNRDIFSPEVRALVFGPEEPLSNAGAYGIESRNIVRYTFSGRTARPLLEQVANPEHLVEKAEATLDRYIAVKPHERRDFVTRLFNPGLCAYSAQHERVLSAVESAPRHLKGLVLTGDYVRGASIEACMQAAKHAVAQVEVGRA